MSSITSVSESTVQPETTTRRRGCLFYLKRGLKWFGIVLVALIVLGVAYQTIATQLDKGKYAPRGQLYTVNGYQMHLYCAGEGSPAVILQAGGAAETLYWYWVQNQMSEHTQVCAFDRPGHGWSEAVDGARDALTINGELHALLEQAGIPTPYIMTGHSFGAVWTQIYAAQYPEQVAGIVLVDSVIVPQPFASQSEFDQWKTPQNVFQALFWGAYRTGLVRLLGPGLFQSSGYPADITPEMVALQSSNHVFDADYAEVMHGMWALTTAAAAADDLGDLPVVVLWAGQGPMSGDLKAVVRAEIADLSSNEAIRFVDGADHGSILGNEQYAQQVTDAILDVIEAAQTGEPMAQ
jgi:pimeloyl-ACP methyl ester carboxylesterase